ncbi:transcription factor HES-3 [Mixophyes fleayi]|uniref:transcription factor HES-3 n=1 Tax=Mixophyes fleayi TaxID=3061075 RepID=UPI003F4DC255
MQNNAHCVLLLQVSKPLMEKKRRARINVSLEQLKSLLEKNYSQNIRKRKLEKADILELTVKYMKTLQNAVQAGAPVFRSAEYQAGFQNCLSSVSRFLIKSEESGGTKPLSLAQDLSLTLPLVSGSCFSTKDSSSFVCSFSPDHKPSTNVGYPGTFNQPIKVKSAPQESSQSPASTVRSPTRSISYSPVIASPNGNRCTDQNVWRPW